MAQKIATPEEIVAGGNPLMRAQIERYTESNEKANFFKKMSEYMFWGATTVLAGLIAAGTGLGGATLAVQTGVLAGVTFLGAPILGAIGTGIAAAAFLGSVLFSKKASYIESRNSVLQSDIDSQNQARRMVQAFAKAQAPDVAEGKSAEVPFAPQEKNWGERVGGTNASKAENWATRIASESQREEAQAVQAFSR